MPKKLKRREREILEALAEERDEDVREDLFKKVGHREPQKASCVHDRDSIRAYRGSPADA